MGHLVHIDHASLAFLILVLFIFQLGFAVSRLVVPVSVLRVLPRGLSALLSIVESWRGFDLAAGVALAVVLCFDFAVFQAILSSKIRIVFKGPILVVEFLIYAATRLSRLSEVGQPLYLLLVLIKR